jgi:hypothetical protein
MDERNERLVMDRIVQTCCTGSNKPQYFLVSPKLLQGLQALNHDDVTILLVWNGPGIKSKWKFEDVLHSLKAKLKRPAADKDDDVIEIDDDQPKAKRRMLAK